MGGRSSIESDPRVREAVDAAIAGGATIEAIVAAVRAIGVDVSRSAVGRYSKRYAQLAKRQRDMQAMSSAFASEFGSADDRQGRLLVQLTTNVLTRAAMELDDAEEGADLSTKEMMELARAVQATAQAAKIDIEREARIREEEAKRVKAAAAAAAEEETRAAGATEETIRRVRARILGIAA